MGEDVKCTRREIDKVNFYLERGGDGIVNHRNFSHATLAISGLTSLCRNPSSSNMFNLVDYVAHSVRRVDCWHLTKMPSCFILILQFTLSIYLRQRRVVVKMYATVGFIMRQEGTSKNINVVNPVFLGQPRKFFRMASQ